MKTNQIAWDQTNPAGSGLQARWKRLLKSKCLTTDGILKGVIMAGRKLRAAASVNGQQAEDDPV
jgi:hypothetical protein